VTYIYPRSADFATLHGCGLKTVLYVNPSMPQTDDLEHALMAASPDVQAKNCAGSPILTYNGNGWLFDPHGKDAATFYQASIADHLAQVGAANVDLIFSDNADNMYEAKGAPCDWSGYGEWTSATNAVLARVSTDGKPLIINTLNSVLAYEYAPSGDTVENLISAVQPTAGGEYEGFLYDDLRRAGAWQTEMNIEIGVVASGRTFWAYVDHGLATIDPGSSAGIAARTYLYASFLLGYDPKLSIFQEWVTTPATFKVMPETGLVALYPQETATSDVGDLKTASGLYERDFAGCYYRGALIGPCRVVVNPTAFVIQLPRTQLEHSMTLTGSDIVDGGGASFSAAAPASVGPYGAVVLVP
jgi:hypothetical protein